MKVKKIILGNVNASPTMPSSGGIKYHFERKYSLEEFGDKLKEYTRAGITVENNITDDEIENLLESKFDITLPKKDASKNNISIDAWCSYYRIFIDREDNVIVYRWNFYPADNLLVKDPIED